LRLIHTADWHLGRLFHNLHLTADQRFILDGLIELIAELQADALIVAGDVFDRAVPPTEAVELLDDVVARVALELEVPVVMIAGNHDSPARLQYFSGLARRAGVHVVGQVGGQPTPARITGRDGVDVELWPLAYTDPETGRAELRRDDLHSHEAVVAAQLELVRQRLDEGARQVVLAHAFVAGGAESESERALSVGGSGVVPAGIFAGFDYVALGHLHRPQSVGGERVRYAGSLLKYSFEEAGHQKSVSVVDLGRDGTLSVREHCLAPRRNLRRVQGSLAELLASPLTLEDGDAYVEVILTDEDPVLDPMEKLRKVFPHLLSLRRLQTERLVLEGQVGVGGLEAQSTEELFRAFFEEVTGERLSRPQEKEVAAAVDEVERLRREVVR